MPVTPEYVCRVAYYWTFEDHRARPRKLVEDIAALYLGADGAATRIQARDFAEPLVVYSAPTQPMACLIAVVFQDMMHVPGTGWQQPEREVRYGIAELGSRAPRTPRLLVIGEISGRHNPMADLAPIFF